MAFGKDHDQIDDQQAVDADIGKRRVAVAQGAAVDAGIAVADFVAQCLVNDVIGSTSQTDNYEKQL